MAVIMGWDTIRLSDQYKYQTFTRDTEYTQAKISWPEITCHPAPYKNIKSFKNWTLCQCRDAYMLSSEHLSFPYDTILISTYDNRQAVDTQVPL